MNTEENKIGSASAAPLPEQSRSSGGFLFLTPELNQRLDLLRHLVVNSVRIPLVKGLAGSGKTTLLERLLQMSFADWRPCRIDADSMLQPDQLYARLGDCFEVPGGVEPSPDALLHRCGELVAEGCIPVVLVDDAHLLPPSTLEALLGLYHAPPAEGVNLRVLLFALPQIEDRIRASRFQAAARQTLQTLDLLPMNREQTEQMVEQILRAAGLSDPVNVTTAQLDRIFRESRGLPGEIGKQVEALQHQGVTQRPSRSWLTRMPILADLSGPSLFGGIIVVVLALGTLIFQDEINGLFTGQAPEAGSLPVREIDSIAVVPLQQREPVLPALDEIPSTVEASPPVAVSLPDLSAAPEAETPDAETGAQAPMEEKPEVVSETENSDEAPASTAAGDSSVLIDAGTDPAPLAPEAGPGPVDPVPLSDPPEVSAGTVVPAPAPKEKESGLPNTPETPPSDGQAAVSSNGVASEPGLPASVEEPSVVKAPSGAPDTDVEKITAVEDKPVPAAQQVRDAGVYRENWLLNQRPESFTLQLIGVGDAEGVQRFLRSQRLRGDVAYFQTRRNGKPWFIVVTGVYPSRAAAVAARDRLPVKLRKSGAWPRTLGSVHEAIRVR